MTLRYSLTLSIHSDVRSERAFYVTNFDSSMGCVMM